MIQSLPIPKIPRYQDSDTGIDYELYWFCTECAWAITINKYGIGETKCHLCGAPTKRVRCDYPKFGDTQGEDENESPEIIRQDNRRPPALSKAR